MNGLFPISSVGEFIHLSRDEKVRMMEIMVDQNKGRVKITPGVGSSLPAESIILAQEAKELGCDGVVVAPPYFYQLSQENIEIVGIASLPLPQLVEELLEKHLKELE